MPLEPEDAWQQVEDWLAAPRAWIPQPTAAFASVLGRLVRDQGIRGPLITDAALAALAIDHGIAVVSTDTDLTRFPDVRWINPLHDHGPSDQSDTSTERDHDRDRHDQ